MDENRQTKQQTAVALRPEELPPVEPELAAPPPRRACFIGCTGTPHPNLDFLATAIACTGWIIFATDRNRGIGDPDYHIEFAYEKDGDVVVVETDAAYDSMHWYMGQPQSYWWFHRNLLPGKAVTVLFDANNAPHIFGLLDPYLFVDGEIVFAARG